MMIKLMLPAYHPLLLTQPLISVFHYRCQHGVRHTLCAPAVHGQACSPLYLYFYPSLGLYRGLYRGPVLCRSSCEDRLSLTDCEISTGPGISEVIPQVIPLYVTVMTSLPALRVRRAGFKQSCLSVCQQKNSTKYGFSCLQRACGQRKSRLIYVHNASGRSIRLYSLPFKPLHIYRKVDVLYMRRLTLICPKISSELT